MIEDGYHQGRNIDKGSNCLHTKEGRPLFSLQPNETRQRSLLLVCHHEESFSCSCCLSASPLLFWSHVFFASSRVTEISKIDEQSSKQSRMEHYGRRGRRSGVLGGVFHTSGGPFQFPEREHIPTTLFDLQRLLDRGCQQGAHLSLLWEWRGHWVVCCQHWVLMGHCSCLRCSSSLSWGGSSSNAEFFLIFETWVCLYMEATTGEELCIGLLCYVLIWWKSIGFWEECIRCSLISLFLSMEQLSHVCFTLLPKPQHICIDIRSMSELNTVAVKIFDIVIHGIFNEPHIFFSRGGSSWNAEVCLILTFGFAFSWKPKQGKIYALVLSSRSDVME